MSQTFSIVCHETKQKLWVGQGSGVMTNFYTGERKVMERLGEFLRTHEGKPLFLLCNDRSEMLCDYQEFGEAPDENEAAREGSGRTEADGPRPGDARKGKGYGR